MFLKFIVKSLQKNPDDFASFYELQVSHLIDNGALSLVRQLRKDKEGLYELVRRLWPDHNWDRSRFRFRADNDAQVQYLKSLEQILQLEGPEGWYQVQEADFRSNGGASFFRRDQKHNLLFISSCFIGFPSSVLLGFFFFFFVLVSCLTSPLTGLSLFRRQFNGSALKAARLLYPNHTFDEAKFKKVPNGFWKEVERQRAAVKQIEKALKIQELNDWYHVKGTAVRSITPSLLLHHKNSVFNLVRSVYADHAWQPWKFSHVPRNTWNDASLRRALLDFVSQRSGFERPEEWYHLTPSQMPRELRVPLKKYSNNLCKLLNDTYTDHKWLPWKFNRLSVNFWDEPSNRRAFLDWALQDAIAKGDAVGSSDPVAAWLQVTPRMLLDRGARNLLRMYTDSTGNSSMTLMLQDLYPEYSWAPHRSHVKIDS